MKKAIGRQILLAALLTALAAPRAVSAGTTPLLGSFFGMFGGVGKTITVSSGSMEPTISAGDKADYDGEAYESKDPRRGDIILFHRPADGGKGALQIGRIVGLPGENIEIRESRVYIDGFALPLEEPYLVNEWNHMNDGLLFDVPAGCFFVLGDNRDYSFDSRYWALEADPGSGDAGDEGSYLKREDIVGRVTGKNGGDPVYAEGMSPEDVEEGVEYTDLRGNLKFSDREGNVLLDVSDLDSVVLSNPGGADPGTVYHIVSLNFSREGALKFREVTGNMAGNVLYISVDGVVVMAPMITGPIEGGVCDISGSTEEENRELVAKIVG